MPPKLRLSAVLVFAAAAASAVASIAAAPVAVSDPVPPSPGSENASATISDLKSEGYDVQINWVNGLSNVDMSQCSVNGINTTDNTGSLRTAYVDVECPH